MEAFEEDSKLPIGPLGRYTIVPRHLIGDCTNSYLQTLLKMQQQFHKVVHYFIHFSIQQIGTKNSLLVYSEPLT